MREDALGDRAERVARADDVAGLRDGREGPLRVARQRVHVLAALEEEAVLLGEAGERVLEAVEDLLEEAGPELDREQAAGELHLAAGREADGVLEDLHVRDAPADADDLAHEARLAEKRVADLVEGDGALERDGDEVAVDAGDGSCGHGLSVFRSGGPSVGRGRGYFAARRASSASSAATRSSRRKRRRSTEILRAPMASFSAKSSSISALVRPMSSQ